MLLIRRRLLTHRADLACGLDYDYIAGRLGFYDTWVARDTKGRAFVKHPLYTADTYTAARFKRGLPAAVECCWNGMAGACVAIHASGTCVPPTSHGRAARVLVSSVSSMTRSSSNMEPDHVPLFEITSTHWESCFRARVSPTPDSHFGSRAEEVPRLTRSVYNTAYEPPPVFLKR